MPDDRTPSTQLQTDATTFHETGDSLKVWDDEPPISKELQTAIDQTKAKIAACFSGQKYPATLKDADHG